MTILLSRTDSIGDLTLALPLAGILKERLPEATIIFLVSGYALEVARCSRFVDEVWNWSEISALPRSEQTRRFRERGIDWFVHVFPRPELARLAREAGIPRRAGVSRRLYHLFTCSDLVSFSRKRSDLHEAQLNALLLEPITGERFVPSLSEIPRYYGFSRLPALPDRLRGVLAAGKQNVILHPKSQGSAPEWSLDRYEALLRLLPAERCNALITGTAGEAAQMPDFLRRAEALGARNLTGATTLPELIALIAAADGLVAASTGPLHLAAALGKRTLGLFAPIRPMQAARWAPVGERAQTLSLERECRRCARGGVCACINAIEPSRAAEIILGWESAER